MKYFVCLATYTQFKPGDGKKILEPKYFAGENIPIYGKPLSEYIAISTHSKGKGSA